ncbi:hypothetical protein EYR38_008829 [Pleurotus pulmonarius]|nr:hypothetical protein EYR38_008829 [Pleurotus pulmonarius]
MDAEQATASQPVDQTTTGNVKKQKQKQDTRQSDKNSNPKPAKAPQDANGSNQSQKRQQSSKQRGLPRDSPQVRLSKTVSWLLRHGAASEGLSMRSDGYVKVTDLLANSRLKELTLESLKDLVDKDAKSRYHLMSDDDDVWWIRANQGHSMKEVKLDLQPILAISDIPTGVAVHGTNLQAWTQIAEQGLSKMKRNHIHLAQGLVDEGVVSGMRKSSAILILIDVEKALGDGIKFFLSANGVVLTEGDERGYLDPKYFKRVMNGKREPLPGWEGSSTEVNYGRRPNKSLMSTGSPSAYLLWAILSCIFLVFFSIHLWLYDKFKCLKWHAGRQPGAFKRVMTYSYLATLPLLVVFGVTMATIKFKEVCQALALPRPTLTSIPTVISTPIEFWSGANRRWLLPLYFVLSVAWSLEIVTHLEELTFWLFLLHQGPKQREWFHSCEFRVWYIGSMIALLGMPLTTLLTRQNLDTCQAWIFLMGSSASTFTTLCFLYVLFRFPRFIRYVKDEGALPDVVIRLVTFYQLNLVRVAFRFIFTIPLLVLAADGIRVTHPINYNPFWSDFLLMTGGIGCFVSSGITLMIFFPRSITQEEGYKARDASPNSGKAPTVAPTSPLPDYYAQRQVSPPKSPSLYQTLERAPSQQSGIQLAALRDPGHRPPRQMLSHQPSLSAEADDEEEAPGYESDEDSVAMSGRLTPVVTSPVSHAPSDDTMWERQDPGRSTDVDPPKQASAFHHRHVRPSMRETQGLTLPVLASRRSPQQQPQSHLHPYVVNFTSPIDLLDDTDDGIPRAV